MSKNMLYGGVEAGGTKFICAVADNPPEIVKSVNFPTTTPQETLDQVISFFDPYVKNSQLKSVGIASFGPVDADVNSPTFGYITATPKPYWQNTDILGVLKAALDVPFAFHHDVSGSAIGEMNWGASQGKDPSLYITIGTGIGGGYIINGKPLIGLAALEMGHVSVPHNLERDPFEGNCPFHKNCFEGLASGPAIQSRFGGVRAETLLDDDPFWNLESEYIAYALTNYIYTLSPRIIVIGGGVMQRPFLFEMVQEKVVSILNGYLQMDTLTRNISQYIVPPALGSFSGVLGAIGMALALDKSG